MSLTTAVITVVLTFILTVVVGNRLLQAWQHRNWILQRRLQEMETQYTELQKTFDEISHLAGKRQHRLFRLLACVSSNDLTLIRQRLTDYDKVTATWNEKLPTQFAKVTMQLHYWLTLELEREIQPRFVSIGSTVTNMAQARIAGTPPSMVAVNRARQELNGLQGRIVTFNKRALTDIAHKKRALYRPEPFSAANLDRLPTWELFKALFKSRQRPLDEL